MLAIGRSSMVVLGALLAWRALGLVDLYSSTIVLIALLVLFFCGGLRAVRRWYGAQPKARGRVRLTPSAQPPRRILIAGAGQHGLSIARDILSSSATAVQLVGFVDDDPAKIGAALDGVRVLGPLSEALALAERHQVSEIIMAMPSAALDMVRAFVRRAENTGVPVRVVRGIERFVQGRDLHRPGSTTVHELLDGIAPQRGNGTNGGGGNGERRVLVTGGAGFIGSHLTRLLLDRGYLVRVLDRFDYGRAGIEGMQDHPRLEIVQGDICNSRDLSRAVRDVEGVLALAAIVGDPACNLDPEETVNLNYTATKILVETCNLYSVRRLVFASSCSVYGASKVGLLTERSRLNPVSLYARTRVLSENILFDRRGDVEPVVLRLATVFGLSPRMRFDLVVNTLTAQAVVERKIGIFGGNQWRPNVHCRDAARAFVLALEAPAAHVAGETFNVGGDALNHKIGELGDMVAHTVGGVEVDRRDDAQDPRDYRVSFAKIRRVLGFEPAHTVASGILEVAAAVRSNPAFAHYRSPVFHNVQAFKQSLLAPRRRRADLMPVAATATSLV
jgi:nucleoside-diphosphate-sugar epimerase